MHRFQADTLWRRPPLSPLRSWNPGGLAWKSVLLASTPKPRYVEVLCFGFCCCRFQNQDPAILTRWSPWMLALIEDNREREQLGVGGLHFWACLFASPPLTGQALWSVGWVSLAVLIQSWMNLYQWINMPLQPASEHCHLMDRPRCVSFGWSQSGMLASESPRGPPGHSRTMLRERRVTVCSPGDSAFLPRSYQPEMLDKTDM